MNALLVVGLVAGTPLFAIGSHLASMTCRRYSSAGISNGTPRTRLGGPGMWAGHPRGQLQLFEGQSGRHYLGWSTSQIAKDLGIAEAL